MMAEIYGLCDPLTGELRRVRDIKRIMSPLIKNGTLPEDIKTKLRLAAQKAPHYFGNWINI